MYQGKHVSHKKKSNLRKPLVLLASTAVLLCAVAGGTLAWLTSSSQVVNTFTPAHVTCAIDEEFDGTKKSNVQIKNTGDVDAYIRARFIVSWQNANGDIYGQPPKDSEFELNISPAWAKGDDGYYYYKDSVAPGDHTGAFITLAKVVQRPTDLPEGFDLAVEIIAEAIQAEGVTADGTPAVEDAWPAWPY